MKTNSLLLLLVFLLLIFLNGQNAFGNHASGGNMLYTHIVGNQYLIRTTLYRDCSGDPAPTSITVNISSAQCSIIDSVVLSSIGFGGEYHLCPNRFSTCQGGTERGIQSWNYEGMYTFPAQCSDWLLSTTISGRPAGITTIQHPASTDLYIEARLNNSTGDNSSPQFTNVVFDIISGQQSMLNFGFVDMDGDSLSYSLISARSSVNTNVVYVPPYSGTQPFTSIPPISIDPVTGDILFTAIAVESTILVCQVNEFRYGDLIGSVMLDLNINTNNLSNSAPVLYGWDQQQFIYYAGPGMMCLTFYSDDPDIDDTLQMIGNVSAMPGATFTIAGNYHPTGIMCWDVDSSDVRPQPYTFTIILDDNACPDQGLQVWGFNIIVTLDSTLINTGIPLFTTSEEKNIVVPNPFQQQAEIVLSKSFANVESQFRIFNAMGKLLQSRTVNANSIGIKNENLGDGIYFFELMNIDGKRSTGRFVIK